MLTQAILGKPPQGFYQFKYKENMPKKSSKPVIKKVVKKAVAEVKENPVKEVPIQKNKTTKSATKNSQLIEMIKSSEEGVTLKQICEKLTWQAHTARSVISRLNKNQNLGIINDKIAGGDRVYKLPKKD
jgi:oxalate decarboxylase/phosphoglucose isomerase-like protein (cupin superfamily)